MWYVSAMQSFLQPDHAPSGLSSVPTIKWGSHVGQIFQHAGDLGDMLVPYFKAGLENNERCLWVADAPLTAQQARGALRSVVPDLDAREARGQIDIKDTQAFYDTAKPLDPAAIVEGLLQLEREAIDKGYAGLRTNGNCSWVKINQRPDFLEYETRIQKAVQGRRLICMCSYCNDTLAPAEMNDVFARHDFMLRSSPGPSLDDVRPINDRGVATAMTIPPSDFQNDIDAVQALANVPSLLETVCNLTGMGFSAIARVTPERWVCLAVHDNIAFGLEPGGELQVDTTLCHEVRKDRAAVVIDHVAEDEVYRDHHTPRMYGIQSYISMPIFLRDGSFFGTLCAIDPQPAKLRNPTVIGTFRLFADLISRQIEADGKLAHTQARLFKAETETALHDQFVALISHDLRNSIAAVMAGAKLLGKKVDEDRLQFITGSIRRSAEHMRALTDDILDMTRGRAEGGFKLRLTREGLEPALTHAIAELQLAYPDREIEARISVSAATAETDPVYMARLLSNLVKNALNYGSASHPVKVDVSTNGNFKLSVSNQGPAIPSELQAKLFERFTRGQLDGAAGGHGLGLYIVSEIARAHGGEISLISTEDETRFTFKMPIR